MSEFNPDGHADEPAINGWEIPLPGDRKVVIVKFPNSIVIKAHRKESESDSHIASFYPELVYPNGQAVFRDGGDVVHRLRLSLDAARALRVLIGHALNDVSVTASQWEITAGAEPGTVDVKESQ